MDKEETIQRLNAQLNQLNQQFEVIKQHDQKIPKIEIDRMLGDIRATYELFTVLNYLNTYGPDRDVNSRPESKREEVIELVEPTVIETSSVSVQSPEKATEILPEILADKFRQNKIEDLKRAIPLHEKFQFINELFGGENGPYNEFISMVNGQKTWSEAESILMHAAEKYRWDLESKTYLKFSALIQRKF